MTEEKPETLCLYCRKKDTEDKFEVISASGLANFLVHEECRKKLEESE